MKRIALIAALVVVLMGFVGQGQAEATAGDQQTIDQLRQELEQARREIKRLEDTLEIYKVNLKVTETLNELYQDQIESYKQINDLLEEMVESLKDEIKRLKGSFTTPDGLELPPDLDDVDNILLSFFR
ncbi:hypothetical protein IJJ08_01240 [bacterium]|nr:hypothetical protein [bacterium]